MAGTLCLWIVLQIAEAELLCCDRWRLLVTDKSNCGFAEELKLVRDFGKFVNFSIL